MYFKESLKDMRFSPEKYNRLQPLPLPPETTSSSDLVLTPGSAITRFATMYPPDASPGGEVDIFFR